MIESEMSRASGRSEAESTTLFEILARYEKEIIPGKKGAVQSTPNSHIKRHPTGKKLYGQHQGADVARLRDEWLKTYAPATVLRRLAFCRTFSTYREKNGVWRVFSIPLKPYVNLNPKRKNQTC